MYYALVNNLSNNKKGRHATETIKDILKDKEVKFEDITTLNMRDFFNGLAPEDVVIICGGDGTLNHFVNDVDTDFIDQKIYLLPTGCGNDFAHDVDGMCNKENGLIPINQFIKNLPIVIVKDKPYKFINGIGFGLDGYVCEQGDKIRDFSEKPVNYTSIAINGLLFDFKPVNARITVDGVSVDYEKVWVAPTMYGKFYGGGMMICPNQNRLNQERTVSVAVWKGAGKLGTLTKFSAIYSGEMGKYDKLYEVRQGHNVHVEFDSPTALQIDGEVIRDVTEYNVFYN